MHELDPNCHQEEWAQIVVDSLALSHKTPDPDYWGFACLAISAKLNRLIEPCIERLDTVTGPDLHVFSFNALSPALAEKRKADARAARRSTVQGAADRVWHHHLESDNPSHFVTQNRDHLFMWLRLDYPDRDLLFLDCNPGPNDGFELTAYAAKAVSLQDDASTDATVTWFDRLAKVARKHRREADRTTARQAFIRDYPFRSDVESAAWLVLKNSFVSEFLKKVLEKLVDRK